jgi:glycosyltransferase involved in cell wall biosynthesis
MISFIIPTKNEISVIEKTLRAVRQYSGEKEIIVSDGNSTDGTVEIIKQLSDHVVTHDSPHRQTISAGRNAGALLAQGEFLIFIDADVIVPNIDSFISNAMVYFKNDPDLIAITVEYKVFPEYETTMDKIMFKCASFSHRVLNNILHIGSAGGEFQMMRAESFRSIGGFNESIALSEDADLFQRLAKIGKTAYIGKLYIYHTGRRAHKIGWPKLIYQWIAGWISLTFFKKSFVDEWEEIR